VVDGKGKVMTVARKFAVRRLDPLFGLGPRIEKDQGRVPLTSITRDTWCRPWVLTRGGGGSKKKGDEDAIGPLSKTTGCGEDRL